MTKLLPNLKPIELGLTLTNQPLELNFDDNLVNLRENQLALIGDVLLGNSDIKFRYQRLKDELFFERMFRNKRLLNAQGTVPVKLTIEYYFPQFRLRPDQDQERLREAVVAVCTIPSIASLEVWLYGVEEPQIALICDRLRKLTLLGLSGPAIDYRGAEIIACSLRSLTCLKLSILVNDSVNTSIGDRGLFAISAMKELTWLSVGRLFNNAGDCQAGPAGITAIARNLPQLQQFLISNWLFVSQAKTVWTQSRSEPLRLISRISEL